MFYCFIIVQTVEHSVGERHVGAVADCFSETFEDQISSVVVSPNPF